MDYVSDVGAAKWHAVSSRSFNPQLVVEAGVTTARRELLAKFKASTVLGGSERLRVVR